MTIGTICTRRVITVERDIDITAAAAVMRENHIGYLIVTDARSGGSAPIGVITDRDIVVKVTAKEVDPHTLTVGDVMTPEPLTVGEDDGISETLHRMRRLGVRRVPVVGPRGQVSGVLSIDDVVDHLVSQLSDVAGSIRNEIKLEEALRS
ncbi:MAG TPA: CBS domain-containing protein [Steroidobacteraceae bacterium]|nr:CBS domain-containing protein [Steroidobacteraceae bacterium]